MVTCLSQGQSEMWATFSRISDYNLPHLFIYFFYFYFVALEDFIATLDDDASSTASSTSPSTGSGGKDAVDGLKASIIYL